jgi:predicted PolB exonuclease-like 3'-5' exonuclease
MFLDIETVPVSPSFDDLGPAMQALWDKKSLNFRNETQSPGEVYQRAGIYAEFGKIICISVGLLKDKNPYGFRLKSFFGKDEKMILSEFSGLLVKYAKNREVLLCAHNGKEFDYPYIARRMIVNGLIIPEILDNAGKKPWEVKLLDTMELWKFGDYKSYTSLDLLSSILGIPSPKDDIDGSMVADIYWKEHDLKRIVRYCEKDVLTVAQILLRFMNLPVISRERVESATILE